jgi:hypothetical protein
MLCLPICIHSLELSATGTQWSPGITPLYGILPSLHIVLELQSSFPSELQFEVACWYEIVFVTNFTAIEYSLTSENKH